MQWLTLVASADFQSGTAGVGDDHRVKATTGGTTTIYVGNYYEKTGSTVR